MICPDSDTGETPMVDVVVLNDNCHRKVITEGTADIFHFGGLADSYLGWGRQFLLDGYMSCTSSEMQLSDYGVVSEIVALDATGKLSEIFFKKSDFEGTFRVLLEAEGLQYKLKAAIIPDPNIECR